MGGCSALHTWMNRISAARTILWSRWQPGFGTVTCFYISAKSAPAWRALGRLAREVCRMENARVTARVTYRLRVNGNWKLILLNFNECLHCPLLHPMLNRLTNYLEADNETPTPTYVGGAMGFRDGAETYEHRRKAAAGVPPGVEPEQRQAVFYYTVYPNLLLSLHPDYMMVHTIWPEAVDRTKIICEWYFHPTELAKSEPYVEDAVQFWDTTNREDWAIVELSQAGIRSRAYAPGPYSKREALLHAFDRIVEAEPPKEETCG